MRRSRIAGTVFSALALSAFAGVLATSAAAQQGHPFDVIIEGGRIVDGTGNAWYPGDVGIRGDRIAAITPSGMLRDAPAARRVDATGMVVSPGFIDIQSHSRYDLLEGNGRVVSKGTMGGPTEIMGESTTNAPVPESQARPGSLFAGPRAF